MTQVIGITESTSLDWKLTTLGWIFSIALFTLGASAAIFGKWLERVGPRLAMFVSALCFSGGRVHTPNLAGVFGPWISRRYWAWTWVYITGVYLN